MLLIEITMKNVFWGLALLLAASCTVAPIDTVGTESEPSVSEPSGSDLPATGLYAEKDSWRVVTKSSVDNTNDIPWRDGEKAMLIRTDVLDSIINASIKQVSTVFPELEPGTIEASHEKHIPVVEVKDNTVTVIIGSVEHPMTEEHSILRRSIVPSLIDILKYNNARKNFNVSVYEIGEQYGLLNGEPTENYLLAGALQGVHSSTEWQAKKEVVDFYYVKGILDVVFAKVGANVKYRPLSNPCPELHPGRSAEIVLDNKVIGYLGELHPTLVKQEDIQVAYVFEIALNALFEIASTVTMFKQISKVPSVERDLALVMDQSVAVGEVVDAIYRCDKNMIKKVSVFDVYIGDKIESGKKSVAVRITSTSDPSASTGISM